MSTVLLVAAVVLALVAALLGFDIFSLDGDPRVLGWLAASIAALAASVLVDRT